MPLVPVPEAAPEMPVARVEAPVIMGAEESVELPEVPVAEALLEPVLVAEEEELEAVGGFVSIAGNKVGRRCRLL